MSSPAPTSGEAPASSPSRLDRLISNLGRAEGLGHPADDIRIVQTHISCVLLTGSFAYKFKKPLNLGFLDFTTLDLRRRACEAELKLNRRFAAELYLEVVAITGSIDQPVIGGRGEAIEYAVKMVEFPQEDQLDRVLARGALEHRHVVALAQRIAKLHAGAERAPARSRFATPTSLAAEALANFEGLAGDIDPETIEHLRAWTLATLVAGTPTFRHRRRLGHVRECHGDLHLTNMVLLHDDVIPFDCIEFNANLRFIDIVSDVAFLVMDLDSRGHAAVGSCFLNSYLEANGDYGGLRTLRHYLVYRSLVRAKVNRIRAEQATDARERADCSEKVRRHVDLAMRYSADRGRPPLIITHGLSGSGKSTVARALAERIAGIQVRSDVERKRLGHGAGTAHSESRIGTGLYTRAMTVRTYGHLLRLAREIIESGFPVIVDGAFLRGGQRRAFRALAGRLGVPFVILDVEAPVERLRERVELRSARGRDASDATLAVLDHQLEVHEPLTSLERAHRLLVWTDPEPDMNALVTQLRAHVGDYLAEPR